jgi:hypothetical protein
VLPTAGRQSGYEDHQIHGHQEQLRAPVLIENHRSFPPDEPRLVGDVVLGVTANDS